MKRPLSQYRPVGPLFSSQEISQSSQGGNIVMTFVSPNIDDNAIQTIQDNILRFSEIIKRSEYPGNKSGVKINTQLDRINASELQTVYQSYNPGKDEFIQINSNHKERSDGSVELQQNEFIMVFNDKIEKKDLRKTIYYTDDSKWSNGMSPTFSTHRPENMVEMLIDYGSIFKITNPERLMDIVHTYEIIGQEYDVERMYLQSYMM